MKRSIGPPDDYQDYHYSVEISEMPVGAFVWLRNNEIPYYESLSVHPDIIYTRVWFKESEHATWFKLRWGAE